MTAYIIVKLDLDSHLTSTQNVIKYLTKCSKIL